MNLKRKAYVVDIELGRTAKTRDGHLIQEVKIPLEHAGTYQPEPGLIQAMKGSLWLRIDGEQVTPNKHQPEPGKTLGVLRLDPHHQYTCRFKRKANSSIHADYETYEVKLTGDEIREQNENYGRPAVKRFEKQKAQEALKQQAGYQPELPLDFSDNAQSDPDFEP